MPDESPETRALSYRYLRIALVGLLLGLAASVFYQSARTGVIGASVSGYYYTSAQTVFTGALIGLGVCMIALQGLTSAEDTFLNLGGICAIVVAVIPTSRGKDFETAVQACHHGGGTLVEQGRCPSLLSLETTARSNVGNNMTALLIVGGIGLALTAFILFRNAAARRRTFGDGWILGGFIVAVLLWLAGVIGLTVFLTWLAAHGHYIAAGGLFAGIAATAGANAHRRGENITGILTSPGKNVYALTAVLILVGAAILIAFWLPGLLSLFWVEIGVAFLFIVFWSVQTTELEITQRTATGKAVDGLADAIVS